MPCSWISMPESLPSSDDSSMKMEAAGIDAGKLIGFMRSKRAAFCALLMAGNIFAINSTEITESRRVYKTVRSLLDRGALVLRVRNFDYCKPYEDSSRSIYSSKSGVVRLYQHEAGSEDFLLTWNHYYDDLGRLRFVLITGGAVNGTHIEHRIWLAPDGSKLRELQKLVSGPGYTFPDIWPEEDLVRDPSTAFSAKNPCAMLSHE